jgi:hypothetical protein
MTLTKKEELAKKLALELRQRDNIPTFDLPDFIISIYARDTKVQDIISARFKCLSASRAIEIITSILKNQTLLYIDDFTVLDRISNSNRNKFIISNPKKIISIPRFRDVRIQYILKPEIYHRLILKVVEHININKHSLHTNFPSGYKITIEKLP